MLSSETRLPPRRLRSKARLGLALIAIITVICDQVTKVLAITFLEGRPPVPVIGQLAGFTFYRNPGAAFGMGAGSTWIFALIAIVVFVFILIASRKLGSTLWAWGLGLLLGGLTGNLIDRLIQPPAFFHGAVVDFIDLHFFICNVADIAISAAAVLLVLASLKGTPLTGQLQASAEVAEHDVAGGTTTDGTSTTQATTTQRTTGQATTTQPAPSQPSTTQQEATHD